MLTAATLDRTDRRSYPIAADEFNEETKSAAAGDDAAVAAVVCWTTDGPVAVAMDADDGTKVKMTLQMAASAKQNEAKILKMKSLFCSRYRQSTSPTSSDDRMASTWSVAHCRLLATRPVAPPVPLPVARLLPPTPPLPPADVDFDELLLLLLAAEAMTMASPDCSMA